MIVGRDTAVLDRAGITRAAVETVAENASDGVIAPFFFMALFGPVGGCLYKAVNTMDSMVGYTNEKYLAFGRTAAKLDDLLNLIPARLTGLLLVASSFIGPSWADGKNAWRIFLRDRRNHKSPNSAHGEAACAGALGLRLAGDAWYFGKLHKKPYIGDEKRPIEAEDIWRAGVLMLMAEGILAALLLAVLLLL
jgi:adenosylcobinamide-phosphate synthase